MRVDGITSGIPSPPWKEYMIHKKSIRKKDVAIKSGQADIIAGWHDIIVPSKNTRIEALNQSITSDNFQITSSKRLITEAIDGIHEKAMDADAVRDEKVLTDADILKTCGDELKRIADSNKVRMVKAVRGGTIDYKDASREVGDTIIVNTNTLYYTGRRYEGAKIGRYTIILEMVRGNGGDIKIHGYNLDYNVMYSYFHPCISGGDICTGDTIGTELKRLQRGFSLSGMIFLLITFLEKPDYASPYISEYKFMEGMQENKAMIDDERLFLIQKWRTEQLHFDSGEYDEVYDECEDDGHEYEDERCTRCDYYCEHQGAFDGDRCCACGWFDFDNHEHSYEDGECMDEYCGYQCEHEGGFDEGDDEDDFYCSYCSYRCEHNDAGADGCCRYCGNPINNN